MKFAAAATPIRAHEYNTYDAHDAHDTRTARPSRRNTSTRPRSDILEMVSFNCDACNDVVKKPKLDQHHNSRCGASFTCLDCSQTFQRPDQWKGHTSCVSEAQKYERSVWQGDKKKKNKQQQQQQQQGGQVAGQQAGVVASGSAQETTAAAGKRKRDDAAADDATANGTPKASKESKSSASPASQPASADVNGSAAPAPSSLQSRVLAALSKSDTSSGDGVTLQEVLELLEKAEGGKEKKLRKELLKGLRVSKSGSVAWL
ncbi:unnamed protein product [Parajaminaea phylloscopi]